MCRFSGTSCISTSRQATMAEVMDAAGAVLAASTGSTEHKTYSSLSKLSHVPASTLWHRGHGRLSRKEVAAQKQYLTPSEEKTLADYILRMAERGYPAPVKLLRHLAWVIACRRSSTFQTPTNNDGVHAPGKNWPQGFYKRHPRLRPRKLRLIEWARHDIYEKVAHWFTVISRELYDPAILAENIYNMDETGILLSFLASRKYVIHKDDWRKCRGAAVKRTLVTAVECISADGRCLSPLIIWPATTHRSDWTTHPTPGWHYACSPSGFANAAIVLEWYRQVFDPQTKQQANHRPRILINDGFGPHESLEVMQFCHDNNIILCRLPSHTSHKLQPCDVAVFGPLKTAYQELAEGLDRSSAKTIDKQHFTLLYDQARRAALTAHNIKSRWAKTGLSPFDPNRVL
jgi:DDE superfamily endonuclease